MCLLLTKLAFKIVITMPNSIALFIIVVKTKTHALCECITSMVVWNLCEI